MEESKKKFIERTIADLIRGSNITIVCFGDSITSGYSVRRGFPSFWKEMLSKKYQKARIELINSGVSGDTTLDGLDRLDHAVLSYKPNLVTINFGINDCVMALELNEFEGNLVQMVKQIRSYTGSEILLLSSQPLQTSPYDKLILDYYNSIKHAAAQMNVGFVDIYAIWLSKINQGMSIDSLILPGLDHPSEAGYKIMAEALMELF